MSRTIPVAVPRAAAAALAAHLALSACAQPAPPAQAPAEPTNVRTSAEPAAPEQKTAPAETAPFNQARPNAPNQKPAFDGQTRAPWLQDGFEVQRQVVASGLAHPWGMAALPTGGWLVTERSGRLRTVSAEGVVSPPITGLPEVDARGQGGLLDVVVRDDFEQTRQVWWSYAEARGEGKNGTTVATGKLSPDGGAMNEVRVILRCEPAWRSTLHFGCRLVFDREGALFVTTGERSNRDSRPLAQDVSTHLGKVLRIKPEGGAADGNPPIPGGRPEIWSYGHRNIQSAALDDQGRLWTVEHGARGGDELNLVQAGRDYGWPTITFGIEYGGEPIGDGLTAKEGYEQPVYYWDPVIAPSGMAFYHGDMFPEWRGSVLIGGLASQALVRLALKDDRVVGETRYLAGQGRIRDVDVAPDGSVLVLTDADDGALIRLTRSP